MCQAWAPLLPKSRGDFAEFLQRDSLLRLSYINQFTCVGFSTVFIVHSLHKERTQHAESSFLVVTSDTSSYPVNLFHS